MREKGDVLQHGHGDRRGHRAVLAPGSSVGFSHPGLSVRAGDRQAWLAGEQQESTLVWLRPSKLIPPHEGSLLVGVHKEPQAKKEFIPGSCVGFSGCFSK